MTVFIFQKQTGQDQMIEQWVRTGLFLKLKAGNFNVIAGQDVIY